LANSLKEEVVGESIEGECYGASEHRGRADERADQRMRVAADAVATCAAARF